MSKFPTCEWCGQYAREDAHGRCVCCGAVLPKIEVPAIHVEGAGLVSPLHQFEHTVLLSTAQVDIPMIRNGATSMLWGIR